MRIFIRNAVFLVTLCVVLKMGLFFRGQSEGSELLLLGSGLLIGCITGALAFYFFQRRQVRGVREMNYNEAKAAARQLIGKQENKENSSHADLLWWFTSSQ